MASKKMRTVKKLDGEKRIIDLMERLGTVFLYTSTPLGQNQVAKAIGIDIHRVSELVKGLKKSKANS